MSERKPGLLSTLLSINTSKNYDRRVKPDFYERIVIFKGRKRLGKHIAETLLSYLPTDKESPKKVLDIGSGTGIISEALSEKDYQVTAVDLSKNALNYLKRKRSEIDAAQLDMNQSLPFAENSFDGVTTVASNRYIDNPEELLAETFRVLKPGGVFLWPIFEYESLTSLKNLKMLITFNLNNLRKKALEIGYSDVKIIKLGLVEISKIALKTVLQPEYVPNFIVAIK